MFIKVDGRMRGKMEKGLNFILVKKKLCRRLLLKMAKKEKFLEAIKINEI